MTKMDDLKHDTCSGCYRWHDMSMGLIPFIMVSGCTSNMFTYRRGSLTMRKFKTMITGVDEMKPFKELLEFSHLKAMPNFDTATESEKRIYRICRESDIRSSKRMKNYFELEEEFNSKY